MSQPKANRKAAQISFIRPEYLRFYCAIFLAISGAIHPRWACRPSALPRDSLRREARPASRQSDFASPLQYASVRPEAACPAQETPSRYISSPAPWRRDLSICRGGLSHAHGREKKSASCSRGIPAWTAPSPTKRAHSHPRGARHSGIPCNCPHAPNRPSRPETDRESWVLSPSNIPSPCKTELDRTARPARREAFRLSSDLEVPRSARRELRSADHSPRSQEIPLARH